MSFLDGLNPEQQEAATHSEGALLILAGAGSGKTTVLVARTGLLIAKKKAKASEIAVMTFTNKAARELKERVVGRLGPEAKGIWTGTFHSFGLQLLRQYHKQAGLPKGFGVIGTSDTQGILKELLANIRSGKSGYQLDTLYDRICKWRQIGKTKATDDDEYDIMTEILLPKYELEMEKLGVVDFQELLLRPLKLIRENESVQEKVLNKFKYLMVDEFQDTNDPQLKLVRELSKNSGNLAVVGDDDQSIYGWRGAQVKNILQFPRMFDECKVVRLERNYRSSSAILDFANSVIAKNKERHEKVLLPQKVVENNQKPEVFIFENDEQEIEEVVSHVKTFSTEGYGLNDIAILYRSNGQGGMLEAALRAESVEYSISGGQSFFDRKEVKDILAYLKCSVLPNEVTFRRILNTPSRGIGSETIKKIEALKVSEGISFYKASKLWAKVGIADRTGLAIDELHLVLSQLVDKLQDVAEGDSISTRLVRFLKDVGYYSYVRNLSSNDESFLKRWTAVEIFGRVLQSYVEKSENLKDGIKVFVDAMALRDLEVGAEKDSKPKVQLLTLHACKGLEFPVVILMGVEEDLLPHRVLGQDISEERRLFYVGVTRAEERLVMTRAKERKRFGKMRPVATSRFLLEVPKSLYTEYPTGFRPVNENQKQDLLAAFYSKLEGNIEKQQLDNK